mmetsp:Transcript_19325/g.49581  ORF Transcript_19325/g.49581 Transcript_19325/m.49581 type:complete len:134 (-) Transcript_19325:220-621(-)
MASPTAEKRGEQRSWIPPQKVIIVPGKGADYRYKDMSAYDKARLELSTSGSAALPIRKVWEAQGWKADPLRSRREGAGGNERAMSEVEAKRMREEMGIGQRHDVTTRQIVQESSVLLGTYNSWSAENDERIHY